MIKTDRGGNITYHGPGQLICYPILDLKLRRKDVSWYLRSIEKSVISLLKSLEIEAFCIPEKTGVWTSQHEKICSIGIRLSRWCSMHGLSLNITSASESGFNSIVPCGLLEAKVTSIEKLLGKAPSYELIQNLLSKQLIKHFYEDFNIEYN